MSRALASNDAHLVFRDITRAGPFRDDILLRLLVRRERKSNATKSRTLRDSRSVVTFPPPPHLNNYSQNQFRQSTAPYSGYSSPSRTLAAAGLP
jgi:hypothetical protein